MRSRESAPSDRAGGRSSAGSRRAAPSGARGVGGAQDAEKRAEYYWRAARASRAGNCSELLMAKTPACAVI